MSTMNRLARYKDIVRLLIKYGGTGLAVSDLPDAEELDRSAAGSGRAEELADDLEALGPTFVKLGQLLSTRPDLVSPAYAEALSRLQDDVKPVAFDEIREVVEHELGVRIGHAFESFEEKPLAAASLGQVHVAVLRDGRRVAVKVQRPGVREIVQVDMDALMRVATLLERHSRVARSFQVRRVMDETRETLAGELDYLRERRNLTRLGHDLREFRRLVVPRPLDDLCTSRVLVMEYVTGTPISALSPVVRTELDGEELADELFRAYLHQVLLNGFFHADPHPGNVLLDRERRVVLLDCGMVGHVPDDLRGHLLELLLALGDGRGSDVARIALRIAEPAEPGADRGAFERSVAAHVAREHGASLTDIQAGRTVLELCRTAAQNGVILPSALTMMGKTLLNLDQIGRLLDPRFDPNAAIRRHAAELMTRAMWKAAAPNQLFATLIETKELAERAPGRINRILELAAQNELSVSVRNDQQDGLLIGLQKVSNRITTGILLGSLVVGAGLLVRVETSFTLFGYPGLAILCFLLAAVGSLVLLADVLVKDRLRSRR